MARVDYEAAWTAAIRLIGTREGWGSDTLIAELSKLAAEHEIPEDFLQKAARLFGELPHTQTHRPEATADTPGEAEPPGRKPDPGPSKAERSRDERAADPPEEHPGRPPAGRDREGDASRAVAHV